MGNKETATNFSRLKSISSIGGLSPATLLKRDSNTGVFLCILRIFIYFEKHLRTAAFDYSFTIVMYLFLSVSLEL